MNDIQRQTLQLIREAIEEERSARQAVDAAVQDARSQGCSWTQIGSELGITKQAAQQRFGQER